MSNTLIVGLISTVITTSALLAYDAFNDDILDIDYTDNQDKVDFKPHNDIFSDCDWDIDIPEDEFFETGENVFT